MTFIPGKSCTKKLLLQLVVSIIQAVPGESRCCGMESWWAITIFLGFQCTFYWGIAVNSVKHDWSHSFPRVLSCEPMCLSTDLFFLFWFSFPPMEIAKATSLLSSQAQYVLSHAVSVGYGVCWCVYICVYVYIMQQACHAAVWWQSNKYNKSRLQNSLWFLEVLGRGRVSWQNTKGNPKLTMYI